MAVAAAVHAPCAAELSDLSYQPVAGVQVRDQMEALSRGDKPTAGAMSMPAEATRPLYESAQKMAAQGQVPLPAADMGDYDSG
jgi:hypothetical protein